MYVPRSNDKVTVEWYREAVALLRDHLHVFVNDRNPGGNQQSKTAFELGRSVRER